MFRTGLLLRQTAVVMANMLPDGCPDGNNNNVGIATSVITTSIAKHDDTSAWVRQKCDVLIKNILLRYRYDGSRLRQKAYVVFFLFFLSQDLEKNREN